MYTVSRRIKYDKVRFFHCERLDFIDGNIKGLEFKVPIVCSRELPFSSYESRLFSCELKSEFSEKVLSYLAHPISETIYSIDPPRDMKLLITYHYENEIIEIVADKIKGKYIISPMLLSDSFSGMINSYISKKIIWNKTDWYLCIL